MDEQKAKMQPVLGRLTYTDITGSADFSIGSEQDDWGEMRPAFSPQIARMSAELAANAYDLDVKQWLAAGWDDCVFVVEDKIMVLDSDSDSRLASFESEWKRRRARSLIHGINPFGDIVRAVRQLMVTDLGKAIVMSNTMPDGKVVVAISFIGTTQKVYDWFSNFKFQRQTGMHSGFLDLARSFEEQSTRIMLPKLAAELGEESYSLADAILDAKKEDSRIALWISGHSQGGAIVQTYAHLLLAQGVPAARIHAYTYAAPTVAAGDGTVASPQAYPIYNIVNADDLVPRVGAEIRLGVDCVFFPGQSFRMAHYRVEEDHKEAFERAIHLCMQVQTTKEALCWGIALMRMMREMEAEGELERFFSEILPQLDKLHHMNLKKPDIADFLERTLVGQLESLTGEAPDEALCLQYADSMHVMLETFGAKTAAKAFLRASTGPHRIRADKHDDAYIPPYIAIARRYLGECHRGIWQNAVPPVCVSASGEVLLPQEYRVHLALGEGQPLLPESGDAALEEK